MIACPACGTENPDRASFCMACGAPVAPSIPQPEERKVVTALFCDLVGFTAMSEAADPEDVDHLLGQYSSHARRVIESHGGTVEKFIGDAVVGVFGVPGVHEDDPERAVRAALRLLDALRAADLRHPDGTPLQARCGVNTGEALVRLDVEPLSGRGFVTGDVVNTAARLQAAAPPMGVAVGTLTHELTAEVIDYQDLPPVVAKGKSEPVRVWLARRPLARTGIRTAALTSSPFLGREKELQVLEEALGSASREVKSRFVLVIGEPGIGKSRLVLEFMRSVDTRPEMTTWRQGHCLPYGEGVTFWALGEIVRQHLGVFESDDLAGLETKLDGALPEVADREWLRQHLRPLLGLDAARASREENYAAWTRLLELIAGRRPTVVVLEDLHWAGEAMLDFVDHLLSEALPAPLLFVATARPELLRQHEGALTAGGERLRRLTLPPLPQQAAGVLVNDLLGVELAPDVRPRIVELAAGNPLYVEQYVRLLLDGDHLVGSPAGLRLVDEALPLPETVQAVLAARLDTLPPQQKALLCDAAVVGETFWGGAVVALSGRDPSEVGEVMAALAARDLVRSVTSPSIEGETEYLFWHALACDVAYGQLPRGVRARKHEAVAQWVTRTTGERSSEFAEILVHHYETALELARATSNHELAASLVVPTLRSLTSAGERALRLDPAAAERHLTRALELAGPGGVERSKLLSRLAEALFLRNHLRGAVEALEEAIERLRAAGDTRAEAVAMCMLAHTLPRLGESDRGLTREAVDLLADDDPSSEQAEVLGMHALSLAIENTDPLEVIDAATRAVEICELLELPVPALALHCRADARLTLGDREGVEDYERAVAAARAQGLGRERAAIEGNRTNSIFALEGPRAACQATTEAMEFDRSHGLEAYVMDCRVGLIAYMWAAGDWARAVREAAELLTLIEDSDEVADTLYVRSLLAQMLAERGNGAQAAPMLPWITARGRESISYLKGSALLGAAFVSARIGEKGEAVALLVECLASPAAVTSTVEAVPTSVRTALGCGEHAIAKGFLECCLAGCPEPRLPLVDNVVRSVEALLAEAGGEHERAAAGFADAVSCWREFGMPYEEAHALFGMGRSLEALGRKPESGEHLAAAAEIFKRLGARPALEDTEKLRTSRA